MRTLFAYVLCSLLLALPASAATVLSDGDLVVYDPAETYTFGGALTPTDPWNTYGFVIGAGEEFTIEVTGPSVGLTFFTRIMTEPDFSGATILNPTSTSIVAPGQTVQMLFDGDFNSPTGEQWISFGFSGDAATIFAEVGTGGLPIHDQLAGDQVFDPDSSGGDPGIVPLPASSLLLIGGLSALAALRRRRAHAA